jgi:hypothetical protein
MTIAAGATCGQYRWRTPVGEDSRELRIPLEKIAQRLGKQVLKDLWR